MHINYLLYAYCVYAKRSVYGNCLFIACYSMHKQLGFAMVIWECS